MSLRRRFVPEVDPPMEVEPNPWADLYERWEEGQEYAHDEDDPDEGGDE